MTCLNLNKVWSHLLGLLLVVAMFSPLTGGAVPPGWNTNLVETLATSVQSNQPVLAYFTASWCGPCKRMAQTTFTNSAVLKVLNELKHVAVDIDEQPKLAERFEIRAVPTFVLLVASGDVAVTTTGYQDADTFLNWLTNGMNEANQALARQREVQMKLAQIDEWLKVAKHASDEIGGADRILGASGGEEIKKLRQGLDVALRQITAALADLCAERNVDTRKQALTRLNTVLEHAPELVLELLIHSRLATRIEAANLLRQRFGETFNVDPWSDAVTRTNAVMAWKGKLRPKG